MRSTVRRMLCSWCSANQPLSFTSMSAVAHQSRMQATLACTTTVYPYSSPVSPDVDVCRTPGWQLTLEKMRTRCLSSVRHRLGGTPAQIIWYWVSYPQKILGQCRYDPIQPISPSTQYPNTNIVLTLAVGITTVGNLVLGKLVIFALAGFVWV